MRKFYKTISLSLIFSILQFFIPLLNVAMEPSCCEENSGGMQCCQPDFPSRLVCCSGNPVHAQDDSAPAQALPKKPTPTHDDFANTDRLVAITRCPAPEASASENLYLLNHLLASNKRYKLLATFLI